MYLTEKQIFTNFLIDSRMIEITYAEIFNLVFCKSINQSEGDDYKWTERKMNS